MRRASLSVSLLAAAACAPSVTVTPAGANLALTPRPGNCSIEFFRTRPPDRPYDEIAALHVQSRQDSAAVAQEAMREKACALGADAVFVTRDYALGLMTGTAMSYRDMRQQHRLDAALRRAEADRAAADAAKEAQAKAKARAPNAGPAAAAVSGPPAGYVQARVTRSAITYETADRRGRELGDVAAGAEVWVGPKPSGGWRRIWRPGEQPAWVEDDALELRAESRAPAAAAEAGKAPRTDI